MPVSNNGARCRIILYKKEISPEEVTIASPMTLGGLKTPEYLKLNPQGKMPLLTLNDGDNTEGIPESDTISRYLLSHYAGQGPSFEPNHTKSNLMARIHDMYLTTIQGCLYKATPPFGIYRTRTDAIAEFKKQLLVMEDLLVEGDLPYLFGNEVTLADATIFPTMLFANYMLPKMEGGILDSDENPLPPKLNTWFHNVMKHDDVFQKVFDEVQGGLDAWEGNNRWDPIFLAGQRDLEDPTIFDKIVAKEIPAEIVYEDDKVLAFKDINPAAPVHLLVIPKSRMGLSRLTKSSAEHVEILGHLMMVAGQLAKDENLGFSREDGGGGRIVVNDGKDGGQEVPHLHLHVLGGRQLSWPPG